MVEFDDYKMHTCSRFHKSTEHLSRIITDVMKDFTEEKTLELALKGGVGIWQKG